MKILVVDDERDVKACLHAIKLWADDFLTKPLNFTHLREKLKLVK